MPAWARFRVAPFCRWPPVLSGPIRPSSRSTVLPTWSSRPPPAPIGAEARTVPHMFERDEVDDLPPAGRDSIEAAARRSHLLGRVAVPMNRPSMTCSTAAEHSRSFEPFRRWRAGFIAKAALRDRQAAVPRTRRTWRTLARHRTIDAADRAGLSRSASWRVKAASPALAKVCRPDRCSAAAAGRGPRLPGLDGAPASTPHMPPWSRPAGLEAGARDPARTIYSSPTRI